MFLTVQETAVSIDISLTILFVISLSAASVIRRTYYFLFCTCFYLFKNLKLLIASHG